MNITVRNYFSIRILTKLIAIGAGFGILLVALIWTRASFAWGINTQLQWAWFVLALVAGGVTLMAAVRTVSSKSLWILVAVDILLVTVIWWL